MLFTRAIVLQARTQKLTAAQKAREAKKKAGEKAGRGYNILIEMDDFGEDLCLFHAIDYRCFIYSYN